MTPASDHVVADVEQRGTSLEARVRSLQIENQKGLAVMFLGVFSALLAGQSAQEQTVRANLPLVADVARAEAEKSIAAISEIERIYSLVDERANTLQNPARALATLVSTPEFLEHGKAANSVELPALSTKEFPCRSGTYVHAQEGDRPQRPQESREAPRPGVSPALVRSCSLTAPNPPRSPSPHNPTAIASPRFPRHVFSSFRMQDLR